MSGIYGKVRNEGFAMSQTVRVDISDGPASTYGVVIPAPTSLLTINAERRIHWSKRAEIVKQWRWSAKICALDSRIPKFLWCEIEAVVTQRRGKLADAGNHLPVVKASIDGLVDAGLVPDDNPEYVKAINELAPLRGETDTLTLIVRGPLA